MLVLVIKAYIARLRRPLGSIKACLHFCITAALLLLYCCFTAALLHATDTTDAQRSALRGPPNLLLYRCFTPALPLLYCMQLAQPTSTSAPRSALPPIYCFTPALLLLYYCITAVLLHATDTTAVVLQRFAQRAPPNSSPAQSTCG